MSKSRTTRLDEITDSLSSECDKLAMELIQAGKTVPLSLTKLRSIAGSAQEMIECVRRDLMPVGWDEIG